MMTFLVVFLTCIFSGVFTGLLGIGGGLIIVPMFLTVMPLFGFNSLDIHHIIGISATCVFLNTAVTVFYRRHEKFFIKSSEFVFLGLAIIIGTILGTYLSSMAPKWVILAIYIAVSLVSLVLLKKDIFFDLNKLHLSWILYPVFAAIGGISASIGIGGAALFTTALKCCVSSNTKKMLPTVTLLVLIHALFAFAGKFALGFVSVAIIPIAFVASLIGSKIGILISRRVTSRFINNALVVVMLLSIARVIFEFKF